MDNGYRYLVLGTGVGKAIAYLLATFEDTCCVTITDERFGRALEVSDQLQKLVNKAFIPFEFNVERDMSFLIESHDVVISALPARFNDRLAALALGAGVHFCDLGGVLDVTDRILKIPVPKGKESVSIITDCGLMPGLGMMLSQGLIDHLDRTESVEILVGGIPQRPRPPVFYQRVFSLEGLKHLCYDPAPVLANYEVSTVERFSDHETMTVSELAGYANETGQIEVFVTPGAARTPWTFQKQGLKSFRERTVRHPGFVDFVRNIPPEKFEEAIGPHINIPVNAENPDLVWMRVLANGIRSGVATQVSYTLLDRFDERTGFTAMERTTGFTTAVIARMMVKGETRPGINTSECALTAEQFGLFLSDTRMIFPDLRFNSRVIG